MRITYTVNNNAYPRRATYSSYGKQDQQLL